MSKHMEGKKDIHAEDRGWHALPWSIGAWVECRRHESEEGQRSRKIVTREVSGV